MKIQGQKEIYDVYFHTYPNFPRTEKSGQRVVRIAAWGRDKIMGGPTIIHETGDITSLKLENLREEDLRKVFQMTVVSLELSNIEEMKPRVTGEAALILIPIAFLLMLIGGFAYIWMQ